MVKTIEEQLAHPYQYGFTTKIATERLAAGLNERVIYEISAKKNEPKFLLAWRLEAYKAWLQMKEPHWGKLNYPAIDYQAISYFAAPKKKELNL